MSERKFASTLIRDSEDKLGLTPEQVSQLLADANTSSAKTKFMTEIDGGLIYSAMMKLYDAGGTGDEMAGISGIAGDDKDNPAFWAGGTYEQAIGGTAKAIIRHDGSSKFTDTEITGTVNANSGKVGYLDIDAGGSLILRDEEGETRLLITKGDVTPIADIGSKVQNLTVDNSQLGIQYMLSGGVENYVQAKKMVIMNNNTHLTISTSISISISTGSGFKQSQGRGRVTVWLKRIDLPDNNILLGQTTVQVDKLSGEPSVDSSGVIAISKSMLIDTGTYEIAAEVWMEAIEGDHHLYTLQGTLGASTMVARFDAANRRTEIGKNGIGIIVDANNYMCVVKEGNGFKVIARTNGVFDMPGVLASGTVAANGGQANTWGAKASAVGTSTITGGRRVPLLNLEHNEYTVQITPHTSTTPFRVGAKTTTGFEALGTGAFDYTVIGRNY